MLTRALTHTLTLLRSGLRRRSPQAEIDALLAAAARLVARGRLPAAIELYRRLLERQPEQPQLLNQTGDLLARDGQWRRAVELYARAGAHWDAHGFHAKAAAIYEKMLRLDPSQEHARGRLDAFARGRAAATARPPAGIMPRSAPARDAARPAARRSEPPAPARPGGRDG